jgi:prolyl oligopeptidase
MRSPWLVLAACASASPYPAYPPAARGATVDRHGAVAVADPYRGLEAMDSAETRAWLAAENQVTDAAIQALPARAAFRARLGELLHQDRTAAPIHRGDHYLWTYHDGAADAPVIRFARSLDEPGQTLVDFNALAEGGKRAFAGWTIDEAGTRVGYATAEGGGDWQVWRLRDVATGVDLPEVFTGIKYYDPAIVPGGVYYSRFPTPAPGHELTAPDRDCAVYFHALGTPVERDRVVYARPDHPSWQFRLAATADARHLVISIGDGEVGDSGQEQLAVLDTASGDVTMLHDRFDAEYVYLGDRGQVLYFLTNAGAPRKRVVAIDLAAPGTSQPIVAEGAHALAGAVLVGGSLITSELRDAHTALVQYDLHGARVRELALPTVGSAYVVDGGAAEPEAFAFFSSFAYPGTPLRVALDTGAMTPWHARAPGFDPAAFATEQVFVTSADGTRVPMFLTSRRGLPRDGTHATLLTGYGFGGVSLTPSFDPHMIAWMERGGVYAVVNVRGGGEYGEAWHDAGKLADTQHRYDDFNAAAAWLADHGVSTPARVGAIGTSGGGMLVAAAMVQRPELYGAAIPIAGVLDLLRFHLFGEGAGWQADLGHPDDPNEFPWLYRTSPLHNLVAGTRYPATLVVTADHDVRVAPLHSYKFAAALQAAQGGAAPILLRVATDSGHGGGHSTSQQIDQQAEILAFAAKHLGLPASDGPNR